MSQQKVLLQVLNGESTDRIPIWLMRQAGRYLPEYRALRGQAKSFLDFCLTPDLAVEATLQPLRRFDLDAAILFSDILVVPYGLGQKVWFEEGVGPRLEPIDGVGALLVLDRMKPALAPIYDTVRRLRGELPPGRALIGFAGAPWTLASYMIEGASSRDFAKAKQFAYGRPAEFGRLIDLLVEAVAVHLEAQVEAGAEVLQIFDSWAGALDALQMRKWSLEPIAKIVQRLRQSAPHVPVIVFPRGIGSGTRIFAEQKVGHALGIDEAIDPSWARENVQPHVVVQGNLDPRWVVVGGKGMQDALHSILQTLAGNRYIFNLGHGVVPETPPEHVEALIAGVRGYEPMRAER